MGVVLPSWRIPWFGTWIALSLIMQTNTDSVRWYLFLRMWDLVAGYVANYGCDAPASGDDGWEAYPEDAAY